jgi:hypothetical protein
MSKEAAATAPKWTAVVPVKSVPVMVTEVPPAVGPEFGTIEVTVGGGTKVNWSAAPAAEVPSGVVTVTSTVAAAWAGDVAVIWVAESTVNEVAATAPKWTALVPVNWVPVMDTVVPPAIGPELGTTEVTVGAGTKVNWSAALVAEVPPGVVTVTLTRPAAWAGDIAVICVAESTVKDAAAVAPKATAVAPVRSVPVMVTEVPPAVGPELGTTEVTVGGATKVNWSAALVAEVPPGVVTVTWTRPAEWAGDIAVICMAESTVKDAAAVVPKATAVAPVRSVPVMITDVPPAIGPELGTTEVTVGAGTKVNWSAALVSEVPPGVVTVTSTSPAAWAGDIAEMCVAESTVKDAAAVVPKSTAVAPVRSVPVMTTEVPPAVGPELGATEVTVGTTTKVNWSAAFVAEVPPGVVTDTWTRPAGWAGDIAVICVAESTVNDAAAVVPKATAVAPVKSVPVMVTEVPPAVGPALGATEVTVGGATKVNWSAALVADVPPSVVTVTSTGPAAWAGDIAVICVAESTVKDAAAAVPKSTAVAPVRSVPVIVTEVPPAIGPALGATEDTAGGGMKVN